MGDYSVVAAITRTMVHLLQDAINRTGGPIAQALVTTHRPDRAEGTQQPQVNLFLFHVLPNPFTRNLHEPWKIDGRIVERPTVALDLYYLISCTGSEEPDKLEPQQLLGVVATALDSQAVLEPGAILRANPRQDGSNSTPLPIASVQINPHALSIEEMSRTWMMFPQVPYQLSMCYRVSAALIDAAVTPEPFPPTAGRPAMRATPGTRQEITAVSSQDSGPPRYGEPLVVAGRNLAGSSAATLGGVRLPVTQYPPDRLIITPTGRGLYAGTIPLRVTRDNIVSDTFAVLLGPSVTAAAVRVKQQGTLWNGHVMITLAPAVQPGQLVELSLFPMSSTGRSYSFLWSDVDRSKRARQRIAVPVTEVDAGQYAVWLKVDGAPSALPRDAGGRFSGVLVTIGDKPATGTRRQ